MDNDGGKIRYRVLIYAAALLVAAAVAGGAALEFMGAAGVGARVAEAANARGRGVEIIAPADGDAVSGMLDVEVEYNVPWRRLYGLALLVDGAQVEIAETAGTEGFHIFMLDTGQYPNGEITIQVKAYMHSHLRGRNMLSNDPAVIVENIYDFEGPEVVISAPADGDIFITNTITAQATCIDESAIDDAAAQVSLDGSDVTQSCDIDSGAISCQGSLADGVHTLTIACADEHGNESAPETVTFTIDTAGPQISITSHGDEDVVNEQQITIEGEANDATTDVVSVLVNGEEASLDGGAWNLPGVALEEGPNPVVVEAEDAAGNITIETIAITYEIPDVEIPLINILEPENGAEIGEDELPVIVEAELSDDRGVDTDSVVVRLGNEDITGDCAVSPESVDCVLDIDPAGAGDSGEHTVTIDARDTAGKSALQKSAAFTVRAERTGPTVRILSHPGKAVEVAGAGISPLRTVNETNPVFKKSLSLQPMANSFSPDRDIQSDNGQQDKRKNNIKRKKYRSTTVRGRIVAVTEAGDLPVDADTIEVRIDGKSAEYAYDPETGRVASRLQELRKGKHIATVTARDELGNPGSATIVFRIHPRASSIKLKNLDRAGDQISIGDRFRIEVAMDEVNVSGAWVTLYNPGNETIIPGSANQGNRDNFVGEAYELTQSVDSGDRNLYEAQGVLEQSTDQSGDVADEIYAVAPQEETRDSYTFSDSSLDVVMMTMGGGGDTTPPTISITAPSTGTYYTSSPVTLSATLYDDVAVDTDTILVSFNSTDITATDCSTITATAVQCSLSPSADGTHTATIDCSDTSANAATQASVTFSYDSTAPSDISFVYDGDRSGYDRDTTDSLTTLSAQWASTTDSLSGIDRYLYAIGTSPGATDTVDWTDNGTSLSATSTGLSLTEGTTYYFSVVAEDGAGLSSGAASSDGITPVIVSPCSTDWPMFHCDIHNTGYSEGATMTTPLAKKWTFETGDTIRSSPVVKDGIIYFGSLDRYIYAVDAETGEEEWSYLTGYDVHGTPAVSEDYVFFGSTDGYIYALDADDGSVEWSTDTNAGTGAYAGPTLDDDNLYMGTANGKLYAIDQETGNTVWEKYFGSSDLNWTPVVHDGKVFIGTVSDPEGLYALDATDGNTEWFFGGDGSAMRTSPAVSGDLVFIKAYSGTLYALDAVTGDQEWSASSGYGSNSSPGGRKRSSLHRRQVRKSLRIRRKRRR